LKDEHEANCVALKPLIWSDAAIVLDQTSNN
jgi:hypothetical protein